MSDTQKTALTDVAGEISSSGAASVEKVERIRELLFGAQIREYTRRFDAFDRSLTQVQQQLQQQIQRIGEQLQTHQEQMAQQLQQMAQKQAEQAAATDQQLRTTQATVLAELRDASSQLDQAKVDRAALGTLFAELGTTLQAATAAPTATVTDWLTQLEEQLR
jgi:chromosome segregation ATPase